MRSSFLFTETPRRQQGWDLPEAWIVVSKPSEEIVMISRTIQGQGAQVTKALLDVELGCT